MKKTFSSILLQWYAVNNRSLPWVGIKDPYKIWLSEIIMQQTRVEQGTKYYITLTKRFPTVFKLANCSEDELMKLWEGLGYYSRARNMHSTAKKIVQEYKGIFPCDFEELKKLKGIGHYTASAIASYAFNKPYAVLDTNVFRVLSRIFGIRDAIHSAEGKKKFIALAQKLLDKKNSAAYNQALMDFGGSVCKPLPVCAICPFNTYCYAYKNDLIKLFPVKETKEKKKTRYFHYLVIQSGNNIIIQKRTEKDIWKNLYQFPVAENKKMFSSKALMNTGAIKKIFDKTHISQIKESRIFLQQLTHQTIKAKFFSLLVNDVSVFHIPGAINMQKKQLKKLAFPGIIRDFLREIDYF